MIETVKGVKIAGTGSYVPERIVPNRELESLVKTSDEWIYSKLGIRERRYAAKGQATSDLAYRAALSAIEMAGIKSSDIDLIVTATATPDRPCPSTACFIQEKLGAFKAAAFDVSAVCSGFLYGLSIGKQFVRAGKYSNVLVIGADTFSTITDMQSRDCVFFGDGAGAVVLQPCDNLEGILYVDLGADGRGKEGFTVYAGGSELPASAETVEARQHYFSLKGKDVYSTAVKVVPGIIEAAVRQCGLSLGDIKYIIPHQPSINILKETAKALGIPFEKILTNMDRYANTAGASVPLLLDQTVRKGMIKKDDHIVLAAIGSGWTWGCAVIKWI